jgi:hypothetical protein
MKDGTIQPWSGPTDIFITPGYRFRAVDVLMTNFHLPRSTLFMLVSAFSGLETMRNAYRHAIETGYRFYSYGDSSLLFRSGTADMTTPFQFKLLATDGKARRGEISMPRGDDPHAGLHAGRHGGTVKAMYLDQVRDSGADIILGNTYHLMLRPGAERVARLGGLHNFAAGPPDPDRFRRLPGDVAGGAAQDERARRDLPVAYRRPRYEMSPERSIEIQGLLGSDIQMQLDECVAAAGRARRDRARRWNCRCAGPSAARPPSAISRSGRCSASCRAATTTSCASESARRSPALDLKGYAVGGLAVGEPQDVMLACWMRPVRCCRRTSRAT